MSAQFGTWIGTPGNGTWTPRIDPALVDDPRFPALLAANTAGISFAKAVVLVTGASDPSSIGFAIARVLGMDPLAAGYGNSSVGGIVLCGLGGGAGVHLARRWRAARKDK